MKKIFIVFILMLFNSFLFAQPERIVVHNGGVPNDHLNLPAPADQPDVYYDDDTQEVIIEGLGFVDYYDVEIAAAPSWTVVLTTQVSGSYDTIDVSSLPQGDYLISIESPLGNTFVGYFDTW